MRASSSVGGDAEGKFTVEFLLLPEGLAEEEESSVEHEGGGPGNTNSVQLWENNGSKEEKRRGRRGTIPEDTDTLRAIGGSKKKEGPSRSETTTRRAENFNVTIHRLIRCLSAQWPGIRLLIGAL